VASVTTTNTTLDGELKSPDWFDASAFPTITFKSTSVKFTGRGTADVAGALTLHGVTQPVVLKVTFRAAGPNAMSRRYSVGFDATASIKRSDFAVAKYVPLVGDEVEIIVSAPFEKQD
jgi:polyisoprenoid-binding protein YceI